MSYRPDNQVYTFQQNSEVSNYIVTSTVIPVFYAASFAFQGLVPDYPACQQLFDQYRIDLIEVWLTPKNSSQLATSDHGILHTVLDYDDNNPLSTVQSALEYTNCISSGGHMGHYRAIKPRVAMAAYASLVSTGYSPVVSPWLDIANIGVLHFGLKTANTPTDISYSFNLNIRTTYSVKCIR